MEVALEPLPFRVSGFDDARARRTKLLETCRRFGLQPFVLEREPGRGRHLLDELVVIEQARRVCEHGDDASFADECRPLLSRGGLHGARARVDETARPDRISEHKARIADYPGERVAQAPWRRRLRQLDDEPRHRRASATRADPAPGDGERGRHEGRGFAEPEPPLGRPIRNEAMVERDGEGGRHAAQVDDPGGHHRPVRPRSSCQPDHTERHERACPTEPEVDTDADEVGGELRTVGDEHEVARAGSAPLRLRVEEQRGQDAEYEHPADVRDDHARALRGGAELPARIGEQRVRRERRARRIQAKAQRERERRADTGVVPLGQEPGEPGRDEQQPGPPCPPPPAGESAGESRPSGTEQRDGADRRVPREPEAGIVACHPQRVDADCDPDGGGRKHSERAAHAPIVAASRLASNQGVPEIGESPDAPHAKCSGSPDAGAGRPS